MNKIEIWEILQTCLLATDGADLDYLVKNNFNPEFARIGLQLFAYLKSKEIKSEVKNEN